MIKTQEVINKTFGQASNLVNQIVTQIDLLTESPAYDTQHDQCLENLGSSHRHRQDL